MNNKLILFAIDSLTPRFFNKFVQDSSLPTMAQLQNDGFSSEVLPVLPPLTGPGWATVVTGCNPSTHGVEGHFNRPENSQLDTKVNAYGSGALKDVETLWDIAEKNNKRTILIKYPVSWPVRGQHDHRIQVCGGGGFAEQDCPNQIVHSRCFTTDTHIGNSVSWQTTSVCHIHLEADNEGALCATLPIEHDNEGEYDFEPKTYDLKITNNGSEIEITNESGVSLAKLQKGKWSGWIKDSYVLKGSGQAVEGFFKLKIMTLDPENTSLQLYMTHVHTAEGYTCPVSLSAELNDTVGPIYEHTDVHDLYARWIDDETMLEIWQENTKWLEDTARYLMAHYEWDLLIVQSHIIDYALHAYLGGVDPHHSGFRGENQDYYMDLLRKTHQLVDHFIGNVLEDAPENTNVVIVGDHGHALWNRSFLVNSFLYQNGWLALDFDNTGKPRVNWKQTKAFAKGVDVGACQIYLNVKGREPNGVIGSEDEYNQVRNTIKEQLYGLIDPVSSFAPVKVVMNKEEIDAFGLYGNGVGDLVLCQKPGYENLSDLPTEKDGPLFIDAKFLNFHSSEHGTFFPYEKDLRTYTVMNGPDIVKNKENILPIPLADFAPTIAHLTGIGPLKTCEGRIITEALK